MFSDGVLLLVALSTLGTHRVVLIVLLLIVKAVVRTHVRVASVELVSLMSCFKLTRVDRLAVSDELSFKLIRVDRLAVSDELSFKLMRLDRLAVSDELSFKLIRVDRLAVSTYLIRPDTFPSTYVRTLRCVGATLLLL